MELNKTLSITEEKFNIAGSIPIVGIISGAVRACAGSIQMLAGAIIGVVGLFLMLAFSQDQKWERLATQGLENFGHGILNIMRGIGEYIAGLMVLGTLGLFASQYSSENKFKPIIKYHNRPPLPVKAPS